MATWDGAFETLDRVWLNTAHQGAMPLAAADSVREGLAWKLQPHLLQDHRRFTEVPARLRAALASLLSAQVEDVVLANSASYGLHLFAHGLPWSDGDEVVVAANDFPSDVLPWLPLRERGVNVILVDPENEVVTPAEVRAHLTRRTRLVCLTWVHSFSGRVIDVEGIGEAAQANGSLFVLNASQGVGAMPIAVDTLPVDGVVAVGFKWLCGPYGTGLCWLRPAVRDTLAHLKLYWLSSLTTDDLASERLPLADLQPPVAGRLDVFGTANFLNFMPFTIAVELLNRHGVAAVARHNQQLVDRFLTDLDRRRFLLMSARDEPHRSPLVVIRPRVEEAGAVVSRLQRAGIDVAQRAGRVRLSPHLYNTEQDIEAALAAL